MNSPSSSDREEVINYDGISTNSMIPGYYFNEATRFHELWLPKSYENEEDLMMIATAKTIGELDILSIEASIYWSGRFDSELDKVLKH